MFNLQRANPFVNTTLGANNIFEFCEKIKNEAAHMQNQFQSLVMLIHHKRYKLFSYLYTMPK